MVELMISAPASGSGKTVLACALLAALKDRGLDPCAFKCGPEPAISSIPPLVPPMNTASGAGSSSRAWGALPSTSCRFQAPALAGLGADIRPRAGL